MERKNFYLSDRQIRNLGVESTNKGISESELLRRIIDDYFESVYPITGMADLKFSGATLLHS